jgi:hypothetical protein
MVVLGVRPLFHDSGKIPSVWVEWKEVMAEIRTTQVEWEDAPGGKKEETVSEGQIAPYSRYLLRSKRANHLVPAMLNPLIGPLSLFLRQDEESETQY